MQSVFAYVRVSTVRQGEKGVSLQEQRSAISDYCARNSLRIVEWFEEQETAASQGRAVFSALIKRLRLARSYGLVVHKIDRSARNLKDWALIQDLIDANISVHFAHESLDLKTRGGRLAADIQAVVAADFIRNLRDEVKKGMYGRLKQGFYPLRAPIGYCDNGGGKPKTIDPVKGPLVRIAFEIYAGGTHSLSTLKDEMTRRGLHGHGAKPLSRSGLATMLKNPFYYGLMRIEANGQTYAGNHEPLITQALFVRVQTRLEGKKQFQGVTHDLTFRKLISCAICGRKLTGEVQKGFVYYRCHTKECPTLSVREETLVALLRREFATLALDSTTLAGLKRDAEELLREKTQSRVERKRLALLHAGQVEERLERLTRGYLDHEIDPETYTKERERLVRARLHIRAEEEDLKHDERAKRGTIEEFLELVEALHCKLDDATPRDIRLLVEATTSNSVLSQKSMMLQWRNGFRALAEKGKAECGGHGRTRTADLYNVNVAL